MLKKGKNSIKKNTSSLGRSSFSESAIVAKPSVRRTARKVQVQVVPNAEHDGESSALKDVGAVECSLEEQLVFAKSSDLAIVEKEKPLVAADMISEAAEWLVDVAKGKLSKNQVNSLLGEGLVCTLDELRLTYSEWTVLENVGRSLEISPAVLAFIFGALNKSKLDLKKDHHGIQIAKQGKQGLFADNGEMNLIFTKMIQKLCKNWLQCESGKNLNSSQSVAEIQLKVLLDFESDQILQKIKIDPEFEIIMTKFKDYQSKTNSESELSLLKFDEWLGSIVKTWKKHSTFSNKKKSNKNN